MSRLDKIRSMNDDELIAFLRKYSMPQAEFERMVGKLTAEQKVYAIYFRIF